MLRITVSSIIPHESYHSVTGCAVATDPQGVHAYTHVVQSAQSASDAIDGRALGRRAGDGGQTRHSTSGKPAVGACDAFPRLGERWHVTCISKLISEFSEFQPCNTGRSWTGGLSHGQISISDAS
jgi:hypothetical protein